MTSREYLERLAGDDALIPARVALKLLEEAGEPSHMTTVSAGKYLLKRSPKWWRERCVRGEIEGAWQDEAGHWNFPTASGRAYLARRSGKQASKKIFRGPNRKAQGTQAARPGAASGTTRPVLVG